MGLIFLASMFVWKLLYFDYVIAVNFWLSFLRLCNFSMMIFIRVKIDIVVVIYVLLCKRFSFVID